ncbi:hypothetical protein QQG74_12805 [Micromonospora sp. FIMYZ51]|uniref:hypothetical protein n=1 Tax=Micromonospora sp. FIMYZ51 TaxID=3051832 RepID=UPI00311E210E
MASGESAQGRFGDLFDVGSENGPKISGTGVFLTWADAGEAQSLLAAKVAACWIETLSVAM